MKKKHRKEGNNDRWLLTYSDLITLLMIFFVVLYASSNLDINKYKALATSFSTAFGGGTKVIDLGNNNSLSNQNLSTDDNSIVNSPSSDSNTSEASKMQDIKKQLDKYMQQNGVDQ